MITVIRVGAVRSAIARTFRSGWSDAICHNLIMCLLSGSKRGPIVHRFDLFGLSQTLKVFEMDPCKGAWPSRRLDLPRSSRLPIPCLQFCLQFYTPNNM